MEKKLNQKNCFRISRCISNLGHTAVACQYGCVLLIVVHCLPLQKVGPQWDMLVALRLAVVAVPMGLLLSRTMAWMSSGKTHGELISRLRGRNYNHKSVSIYLEITIKIV